MPTSHYQFNRLATADNQVNQPDNQKVSIWKKVKLRSQEYASWLWILILAIYITSSAVRSLVKNYYSNLEIKRTEERIAKLTLQKQGLEAQIAYLNTDAYKEKELRKRLLLKRPEEYVVAFPERIENRNQKIENSAQKNQATEPIRANWEKWLDYFKGSH